MKKSLWGRGFVLVAGMLFGSVLSFAATRTLVECKNPGTDGALVYSIVVADPVAAGEAARYYFGISSPTANTNPEYLSIDSHSIVYQPNKVIALVTTPNGYANMYVNGDQSMIDVYLRYRIRTTHWRTLSTGGPAANYTCVFTP